MSEALPTSRGVGAPLLPSPHPDVRESDDAGQYYCAHALFLGHVAAEQRRAPFAIDDEGDPLVGFLHVPPDERTLSASAPAPATRHAHTRAVVASALAGWVPCLARSVAEGPLRVVLTGFGSFGDVVDNPTGDFVRSRHDVAATLSLAFGERLLACDAEAGGDLRLQLALDEGPRELRLTAVELPVDDRCLAFAGEASLLALLERSAAHAWLGLGVSRSPYYRAETLPHDGGLQLDDEGARHTSGRAPGVFPRRSRALVRGLLQGGPEVSRRLS